MNRYHFVAKICMSYQAIRFTFIDVSGISLVKHPAYIDYVFDNSKCKPPFLFLVQHRNILLVVPKAND